MTECARLLDSGNLRLLLVNKIGKYCLYCVIIVENVLSHRQLAHSLRAEGHSSDSNEVQPILPQFVGHARPCYSFRSHQLSGNHEGMLLLLVVPFRKSLHPVVFSVLSFTSKTITIQQTMWFLPSLCQKQSCTILGKKRSIVATTCLVPVIP